MVQKIIRICNPFFPPLPFTIKYRMFFGPPRVLRADARTDTERVCGMAYHDFPWQKGASDSFAKLLALSLPALQGKSVLDVGCNEGYFCG